MKILHINSYYARDKFYKNLTDILSEHNVKSTVYLPVSRDLSKENFDYGSNTVISKCFNKIDRFLYKYKYSKIYKDIQRKVNILDYDLIHAHALFSNGYVAYKINKKYGIPYFVAVRDTDMNLFFKRFIHLRSLGIKILLNASKIIFIGNEYKNQLIQKYIPLKYKKIILEKSIVIPNGIDQFWLDNKAKSKSFDKFTGIKLLQVGEINKNKNVLTTIKTVKHMRKIGYNISLTVIGKSKSYYIYRKIKKEKNVNFLGYLTKEDLLIQYRNHDIFILPSYTETFGLVYAEAMSQGLPVIYSKGQGFDNQFKDGFAGYAINPSDPNDIAEKIVETLKCYDLISTFNLINVDKFNWNEITRMYLDLYAIKQ